MARQHHSSTGVHRLVAVAALVALVSLGAQPTEQRDLTLPKLPDFKSTIARLGLKPVPENKWAQVDDDRLSLETRIHNVDVVSEEDLKEYQAQMSTKLAKAEPTIKQVLVLHRHGDRTPVTFRRKDPLQNESFWPFHGYGQLTNRGKIRLFMLGKLLRKRYNDLLGSSVNKNERLSRASGSTRCVESAQMVMASMFGLDVEQSSDAAHLMWNFTGSQLSRIWQPVNVQTLHASMDGMLAEAADCNELDHEYDQVIDKTEAAKKIPAMFAKEAKVMDEVLAYELDHFYKWAWAASQLEVESSYFPDKFHPKLTEIYERIQEAGRHGMVAYQASLKAKRLRCGLLMNDMVSHMRRFLDLKAKDRKKMLQYAGHDVTVANILGMLDNWNLQTPQPSYAASVILELHQKAAGGPAYVKFFYLPRVPSDLIELHMAACEAKSPEKLCTLDAFEQLMKPYMVDSWVNWQLECKNDPHKLNPYEIGH